MLHERHLLYVYRSLLNPPCILDVPCLTDAVARSTKAPEDRSELVVWDDETPGFCLRIRRTGGKRWGWVRRNAAGKVERYTIGAVDTMKAAAARAVAEQRNAEREAMRHGIAVERLDRAAKRRTSDGPTLRELAKQWISSLEKDGRRPNTLREYGRHRLGTERRDGTCSEPQIGGLADRAAAAITRSEISTLIEDLEEETGAPTARAVRASLSACYSWALERSRLPDTFSSPVVKAYRPQGRRSRERVLTPDELRLIWRAIITYGETFGPIAQLLLLTGQRR